MKKLMLMLCVLCIVGVAGAASVIVGPYPNYKGTVQAGVYIQLPSTADMYFVDPFGGVHHIAGRGGQLIESGPFDLPVFARSYHKFDSSEGSPFDPSVDDLILTEIWAKDMDPGLPEGIPDSEGFENPPAGPEFGAGHFKGRSGTEYSATVTMVEVGDLATTLPDYDLTGIAGDPAKVVCVAQATVPANEFIIEAPSPYFLVDANDQWQSKLNEEWPDVHIRGLTQEEGQIYLQDLNDLFVEGLQYSPIYPDLPEFIPPKLYVFGGNEANPDEPNDAGLVMEWGDNQPSNEEKAAAWKFEYGDPDLSNCIITVTAMPPSGCGINRISIGMQDINGNICSWWWVVPTAVFPHDSPTTVKIDTTQINAAAVPPIGFAAATPAASGFACSPAFDLTKVASIIADENANLQGGVPVPPPGGSTPAIWNYWHNLSVTPKTTAYKGSYVKYSQPPMVVEDDMIYGWDVKSVFPWNFDQSMTWTWAADDWRCYDERPVTDVHWWGSFIGWTQPYLPTVLPDYFMMAIWRDVPADAAMESHPKELLWLHQCDNWVWNYAGYDKDPRFEFGEYNVELFGEPQENEACFQFNQLLSEDDWFYQEPMEVLENGTVIPNVYWFSITAVYKDIDDISQIEYPWGWKTKPFDETKAPDAAVVITGLDQGTPPWETLTGTTTGHITEVVSWFPLILPDGVYQPGVYDGWWDLAFELTTNEPKCPGLKADLNDDCIVNLPDFAIMADDWLNTSP